MMGKRGDHMKTIVVRKKRSHRVFALIMGVVTALMPVITSLVTRISMGLMLLCFAPAFLLRYYCDYAWVKNVGRSGYI